MSNEQDHRTGSLRRVLVITGVAAVAVVIVVYVGFLGAMSNMAHFDIPVVDAVTATTPGSTSQQLRFTTTTIEPRLTTTAATTTTTTSAPTTTAAATTTSTLPPVGGLEAGLFCRDLNAFGYHYAAAVTYWTREGSPDRMDADRNGIPCETVYPAADVLAFWGDPLPTTTQPPTDTTTVRAVVNWIQAGIDAAFAQSDPPDSILGPSQLDCADAGSIRVGGVLSCMLWTNHDRDFEFEDAGVTIYVLDTEGRAAWSAGTDGPGSTEELQSAHARVPSGLFCRDLLNPDVSAHPFSAFGRPPTSGFFWSLVYWSLEGEPDRMDADRNGIPCETLYDASDVASVLAGGPTP